MFRRAVAALSALLSAIANWRFFKPAVFLACLAPGALLGLRAWQFFVGGDEAALGVDPAKTLQHETGETALTILLITLTVTPIRRIFSVNRVQLVRRMLGVWAFTYALIHLSLYLVLDQLCYSLATCEFRTIWEDLLKRPFIFIGQLSFLILLLLAMTSTNGWVRRLRKNWARLHRLAYVAAVAGLVHFIWVQKASLREPMPYLIWLVAVLGVRVYFGIAKRRQILKTPVTA
jgi:methionine sulfoxide reductase heme-binding subunit